MRVALTWVDTNYGETGHRVYRSTEPMDPENLPEPLVELGPDVEAWEDDGSGVDPSAAYLYYRVGAVYQGQVFVSAEARVKVGADEPTDPSDPTYFALESGYEPPSPDSVDFSLVSGYTPGSRGV